MKIDLEKEYKNKKDYQIYTSARNKEVKESTEDNPPKVSSLSRRESKKKEKTVETNDRDENQLVTNDSDDNPPPYDIAITLEEIPT